MTFRIMANRILVRRFDPAGPRRQRGSFFSAVLRTQGGGGRVLLDPLWTISNHDAGSLSICSVTFNTDGSMSVARNGGGDTLPAADNWWTDNPETDVGDDYEVAFTAWDGGSVWSTGAAINVWTALTSDVGWSCRVIAKASPDTQAANNVTFEIRPAGGGSSLDTITGCNHSASN